MKKCGKVLLTLILLQLLACCSFASFYLDYATAEDQPPIAEMKSAVGLVYAAVQVTFDTSGGALTGIAGGTGTCFLVGNGDCAITNYHVVEILDNTEKATNEAWQSVNGGFGSYNSILDIKHILRVKYFDKNGTEIGTFDSNVLAKANGKDLALISIPNNVSSVGVMPVKFLRDEEIKVGSRVFAVGFPLAANIEVLQNDQTVSDGCVSKKDAMIEGTKYIQTNANINHGNSGGPLYDAKGNVMGVNTLTINKQIAEGIGFAVQSSEIIHFLEQNNIPVQYASEVNQIAPNEGLPASGGNTLEGQGTGNNTTAAKVILLVCIPLLILAVCLYIALDRKNKSRRLIQVSSSSTPNVQKRVPRGRIRVADGVFTLTGVKGSFTGMNIPFHSFPASMGRDTSLCKVQFAPNTKGVSRLHCTISFNAGVFTVTDSSTYGTYINGSKINPNTPTKLHNCDLLACAGEVFRVTIR